jgi:hypothetical protein
MKKRFKLKKGRKKEQEEREKIGQKKPGHYGCIEVILSHLV